MYHQFCAFFKKINLRNIELKLYISIQPRSVDSYMTLDLRFWHISKKLLKIKQQNEQISAHGKRLI